MSSKPVNPQWLVDAYPNDLKAQINYLVSKGYHVLSKDEESAQLLKQKSFSCLFCCLTLIIPYLIWYMSKRDKTIYLDLSAQTPKSKDAKFSLKNNLSQWYDEVGLLGVFMAILAVFVIFTILSTFLASRSHTDTSSVVAPSAATTTATGKGHGK